jgi:cellulose biosynthesis protein BcsQ
VFVSCWSVKGGSGTTVVAAALALLLARRSPDGALLVDLAGDAPAALGLGERAGPGVHAWLAAGGATPPDALARLEVAAAPELALLPAGDPPAGAAPGQGLAAARTERAALLASLLAADPRPVVVDCGPLAGDAAVVLAGGATASLLVLRPCYLALRRAQAAPLRPSGVVLVVEPGRALGPADVEAVLGVPVRALVPWDPAVARCVDAGLLARRLPRQLERPLQRVA